MKKRFLQGRAKRMKSNNHRKKDAKVNNVKQNMI